MNAERLLTHYERIADAPDAIPRLRRFILDLAVRGKLVPQNPSDGPASELLKRIQETNEKLGIKKIESALGVHETPFEIPIGWAWRRLGEICSKTGSGSTPRGGKEIYKNTGISFLRSQNVYNDGVRFQEVAYIDAETHSRMSGTRVLPGDLLLNITGGSIGRCCCIPESFCEANVSQHVAIIRPTLRSIATFLHRLIFSPYFQAFVVDEQTGAGRGGLPKNRMDRIGVPLPPLAEQHRIVARVDELMALCDRLERARAERETTRDRLTAASLARLNAGDPETFHHDAHFALDTLPALTTRPDQIRQLRQTILNLAVRGKLVPQDPEDVPPAVVTLDHTWTLPENWCCVRLASLLAEETRNGYSRRPDDAPDGTPILRISAGTIRRDGIVAEEEHKLISGIDIETRLQYGLRSGDLLACRFNGNKAFVGRLTQYIDYLGIGPIYPDKLIRVRVSRRLILPRFLQLAGDSDMVRAEIEAACATTVGNWGISASALKVTRFPIPPLAEQHRIVAKVDQLMALCDGLSRPPANGRWKRLFAWDEGCGGKHAGKIDADG